MRRKIDHDEFCLSQQSPKYFNIFMERKRDDLNQNQFKALIPKRTLSREN